MKATYKVPDWVSKYFHNLIPPKLIHKFKAISANKKNSNLISY